MEKIVFIKRSLPFVHDQVTSEVMLDELAAAHKSIGSYYNASGQTGTGMDYDETQLIMSTYFTTSKSDPKLREQIETFFQDITTKVPGKKGLELNIGLKDNTKPVAQDNMPDKILDYIRYRHALGYSKTAPSPEAAAGNSLMEFYIEDPLRVLAREVSQLEMRDNSLQEYLKLKEDNDRVNMMLSLMKAFIRKEQGKPPINLSQIKDARYLQEKQLILRDLVNMRPERFYTIATDPQIKKKYFIDELMSLNILRKIGNSIVDTTDQNRPLGYTPDEVLVLLNNGNESSTITRLRAELELKYAERKNPILA